MIVYAVVARRTAVLAEFTMTSGNFPSVTRVLLSKITDKDSRLAYDQHVFHYVTCEDHLPLHGGPGQQAARRLRLEDALGGARAATAARRATRRRSR
ncbi:SNAP receptor [Aureococcus anophagefferens]|nr:SNAP receptor [Aureococcus anophagefferens]